MTEQPPGRRSKRRTADERMRRLADVDAAGGHESHLVDNAHAAEAAAEAEEFRIERRRKVIICVDGSYSGRKAFEETDDRPVSDIQHFLDVTTSLIGATDDDGESPLIIMKAHATVVLLDLDNYPTIIRDYKLAPKDVYDSTNAVEALAALMVISGNSDLLAWVPPNQRPRSGKLRRQLDAIGYPLGDIPDHDLRQDPPIKPMEEEVLFVFLHDGLPNQVELVEYMIRLLSYRGVFIKVIYFGDGSTGREWLEHVDRRLPVGIPFRRGGRKLDNVHVVELADLRTVDARQLFQLIFRDVAPWEAEAIRLGMFPA